MAIILRHIDDSLVGYTPEGSDFLQLVSETLGNVGDSSDGWDSAFATMLMGLSEMEAILTSLDETTADITTAMTAFNAIDTASPFLDFPSSLPALGLLPGAGKLAAVPPLALPGLPPAPGVQPPPPPPTVCLPVPPTPPAPTPTPTPAPSPAPQPPCPQGWSFVSGKCQPPPRPNPGGPGLPPVILPPLPAGLPPCPPGGQFLPGVPCHSYPDPGNAFTNFVMPLGEMIQSEMSAVVLETTTSAWLAGTLPGILIAAPLVGAIIGVGALLFHFLGGGCGEACIDASKIEQVFEAAADNLFLIARAGMLPSSAAVAGMTHYRGVGDQAEHRLGTTAAIMGSINLEKVINAEIAAAKLLPDKATQPLTLAAARALYVGGPGWYPDSIDLASKLTDQFVVGHIQAS